MRNRNGNRCSVSWRLGIVAYRAALVLLCEEDVYIRADLSEVWPYRSESNSSNQHRLAARMHPNCHRGSASTVLYVFSTLCMVPDKANDTRRRYCISSITDVARVKTAARRKRLSVSGRPPGAISRRRGTLGGKLLERDSLRAVGSAWRTAGRRSSSLTVTVRVYEAYRSMSYCIKNQTLTDWRTASPLQLHYKAFIDARMSSKARRGWLTVRRSVENTETDWHNQARVWRGFQKDSQ